MRDRPRVHLLGMPHTETTSSFEWCAYTSRTRDLATVLTREGWDVVLYAGEENDAECLEHVPLVSRSERLEWFRGWDPLRTPWNPPRAWDPESPWWSAFNSRAVSEIAKRSEPGDIIAITMGTSQQPVAVDPMLLPVEIGVGYSGVWAPYRVFESWAWRHFVTGSQVRTDDVRFFDDVIPRPYLPEKFAAGDGKGGYLLYMGRLMARKGPHIAAEAAHRAGLPLLVAGQGMRSEEPGLIVCEDGTELRGDVRYLGVVGPNERAELMGNAVAVLVPTMYLEPFGGVSVEAQLCGTPAIVSDWGGLTENVEEGKTGFRCSMLRDFARAIELAPTLDRGYVRQHAQDRWGSLGPEFTSYLERLGTLWSEGWYAA